MGDFLRTHWLKFVIGGAVALGIGVILIIVGIYYIATGENSTTKKEFEKSIPQYQKWAEKELQGTTFRMTSPLMSGTVNAITYANPVTWSDGTVTNFNQTVLFRQLTFSSLAAIASSSKIEVGASLTYTTIQGTPTKTLTSTVTSAATPLVNSSGSYLSSMCVVIKREYANSEWIIDTDKKSCFYPFDADNNQYVNSQPSTVSYTMLSRFDPLLLIQHYNKGDNTDSLGRTKNKDLYLVDSNTPTVFGLGGFLLVAGIAVMITFGCFCRPKPLDADPNAQAPQPGQVQQGVPVYGKTAV